MLAKKITMEHLSEAKARLDAMRPLWREQIERLWPMWVKEDALYVYASNAIEGNTLTLGETTVVLEDGVTIGGKTVKEHLEVINGAKAYALMLDMAKANRPITVNTLLAIHEASSRVRSLPVCSAMDPCTFAGRSMFRRAPSKFGNSSLKRSKPTCAMSQKSMLWSRARNCTLPLLTSTRSSTEMDGRLAS